MNHRLDQSDKHYWHHFTSFYDEQLAYFECADVLEFGVWKGASIRWLRQMFPLSNIYGIDILNFQSTWPHDNKIKYYQADQGDIEQIRSVFSMIDTKFDLIIEDGSHFPMHQRNCLVESLPQLRCGGIYILEDIHTSHPRHPYYKKIKPYFRPLVSALHLLLGIQHIKSLNNDNYVQTRLPGLAKNSLFSLEDVYYLYDKIDSIKIFKRTLLPEYCFSCGENDFDYSAMKCKCGTPLYAETDSMSALLRVN